MHPVMCPRVRDTQSCLVTRNPGSAPGEMDFGQGGPEGVLSPGVALSLKFAENCLKTV